MFIVIKKLHFYLFTTKLGFADHFAVFIYSDKKCLFIRDMFFLLFMTSRIKQFHKCCSINRNKYCLRAFHILTVVILYKTILHLAAILL